MAELNETIKKLAEQIGERLKIDEAGNGTVDPNVYVETLPEDLSMDTVEKVRDHDCAFAVASTQAFGQAAAKVLVGDKADQTGTCVFPMGQKHYQIEVAVTGRDEIRKPGSSDPNEKITRYGVVKQIIDTAVDPKSRTGSMGIVSRAIAEAAMAAQGASK